MFKDASKSQLCESNCNVLLFDPLVLYLWPLRFSLPWTELIMKIVLLSLWYLQSAWSAIAKQQIAFATIVCSADCNQASCVGEKPTERWCPGGKVWGEAGSMSVLKALAKAPPFNPKSFWGALASQDLNSELVYSIYFSSLTWEVSAGSVSGRAVGELGMPPCPGPCAACEEVSGLPTLRGAKGSKKENTLAY